MRAPRRSPAVVAALVAVALVLSACGIATEANPRPLPKSQVPFHLLAPAGSTTTTTISPVGVQVVVYFLRGQKVAPVYRFVAAPVRLRAVMQSLVNGPYDAERNQGLSTDISTPQIQVLSATVANSGVATVNFNQAIAGGSQQIAAVAQVVYTATAQTGVQSVRFEISGKPAPVPTASNVEVGRPVTRADYAPYAPVSDTPTF